MTQSESTGAQEFTVDVQAGKEKQITAFGTRRAVTPLLWVTETPENGATDVRGVKVIGPCYGRDSKSCTEDQSNGQGLFYRPNDGFRGTDRLRVDVSWPSIPGAQVVQIITLQVK